MPFVENVLEKYVSSTKKVTLIVRSGANCCEITGCLVNLVDNDDGYVVLLNNDNNNCECPKTFVRINCICAVKVPGVKEENDETDTNG